MRLRLTLDRADERCDGCDLAVAPILLRLKNMEVRLCPGCVGRVLDTLEEYRRARQANQE